MIFDAIGLTLMALGVARLQVKVEFLPEILRFPHYDWATLLLGLALMLPTAIVAIRYALTDAKA